MNAQTEMATAGHALDALARIARTLTDHFGATLDVRRFSEDVQRLRVSLSLLSDAVLPPQAEPAHDLVAIPDLDYDPSFWLDADHEGVGGVARLARPA
jgi:hypothetical protein